MEHTYTPEKVYTDNAGLFPVTYRKATKYIIVLYCYYENYIIKDPLKDRERKEILMAYKKVHEYFSDRYSRPTKHCMDNEA